MVELGQMEVTSISPTGEAEERHTVFDLTNLTDGIRPLVRSDSAGQIGRLLNFVRPPQQESKRPMYTVLMIPHPTTVPSNTLIAD